MESELKAWKTSRNQYLQLFDKYSLEQMNIVPEKFSNNIIWNIGHIIAAHQAIVYKTSNLPLNIQEDFFDRYKPGTRPMGTVSANEMEEIKTLLISMISQTETDLANGKFVS